MAGLENSAIHTRQQMSTLPGFYRPVKGCDIVAVVERNLLVAIELKSQVGSFGNNFNNRIEEALGGAEDIWTAYREGAFDMSPAPWVGYLLLLEDSPRSRKAVRVSEPHLSVFDEFRSASYAKRYELFCRKLVRERKYDAACFIIADPKRVDASDNYAEPAVDLSAARFLSGMLHHVHNPDSAKMRLRHRRFPRRR